MAFFVSIVVALLSAWLSLPDGLTSGSSPDDPAHLASLAPYAAPAPSVAQAPPGFEPVFVEHVGRHGSRALTSGTAADRAVRSWKRADADDALTDLGRRFGDDARTLRDAMKRVGYGQLSARGEHEQRDIGTRVAARLSGLFDDAVAADDSVQIVTSGKDRTVDSAARFVDGLHTVEPDVSVEPARTDTRLLHFDTTDPDYAEFLKHGTTWRDALSEATARSGVEQASERALRRLYSSEFVDSLSDPVREANAIYELVRATPAMAEDTDVDLAPYMRKRDMAVFAYLEDARVLYSRGPGIAGDDRSFRPADVLLDDFFDAIDARLDGNGTAAVFRFAHGEEIVPFAALLRLPGSTEPVAPGAVYSYDDNDFRTGGVSGLSANIEWDVVRNEAGEALVTMRYNEVPTRFDDSCRASEPDGYYYSLDELRSCLPPH